jgi:hypothetical protein
MNQQFNTTNITNDVSNTTTQPKTSVRVKYPSGGKSQICFGTDNTNYDDYRKNK